MPRKGKTIQPLMACVKTNQTGTKKEYQVKDSTYRILKDEEERPTHPFMVVPEDSVDGISYPVFRSLIGAWYATRRRP